MRDETFFQYNQMQEPPFPHSKLCLGCFIYERRTCRWDYKQCWNTGCECKEELEAMLKKEKVMKKKLTQLEYLGSELSKKGTIKKFNELIGVMNAFIYIFKEKISHEKITTWERYIRWLKERYEKGEK